MDRRSFVSRVVPAAAGVAVGCAAEPQDSPSVQTRPRITWRLASSFPRTVDSIYGATERVAARVAAITDGRFTIRPSPGGDLVPALQVLDAVQQGTVELGQSCGYYFTGKNPSFAFDTRVPFGLSARQQWAWLLEAGGLDLLRRAYADFGVITFPGGNTGVQMGGWFKQTIGSAEDLKGLKIRVPGLGGQVMNRLGATVQVLPGGEIFQALERGIIDAAEWVGPYDDEELGFHKAASHYYFPGWWEPSANISFYVNQSKWESLPTEYQEALEAAFHEAGLAMQAAYDARNPPALERLRQAGVQLHPFPTDVMDAAAAAAESLFEEEAAKNAQYREIHAAWDGFRQASNQWFGTAESSYSSYAFRG